MLKIMKRVKKRPAAAKRDDPMENPVTRTMPDETVTSTMPGPMMSPASSQHRLDFSEVELRNRPMHLTYPLTPPLQRSRNAHDAYKWIQAVLASTWQLLCPSR